MGEDASLDDFITGESEESVDEHEGDHGEAPERTSSAERSSADRSSGQSPRGDGETASEPAAEGVKPEEAATAAEPGGMAPTATTYAWDGEGAPCEVCGETVEERWQQDSGLVCTACKDWERA